MTEQAIWFIITPLAFRHGGTVTGTPAGQL
jgi:hypothetical protein